MHDEARPFEKEGAAILNDVRSFLSRFVVYPSEHAKIAHALWVGARALDGRVGKHPTDRFPVARAWIGKNARDGGD